MRLAFPPAAADDDEDDDEDEDEDEDEEELATALAKRFSYLASLSISSLAMVRKASTAKARSAGLRCPATTVR